MQILIAAVLVACAAGFGAGGYIGYEINAGKMHVMENQIITANANASLILKNETDKVAASEANAIKSNIELDASHEAFIKTVVDYDRQLDSIRLYTDRRLCSPGPSATNNTAGISKEAAGEAELDAEIESTIKEAAIVADTVADYADKAYQFAFVNNCGIKP